MKYLGKITDEKDLISREFSDHYGECTTGASTQAKVVTIPSLTELYEGLHIYVKFTTNQTYNGVPTLNVNGLGAKNIRRTGGENAARYEWVANQILHLIYDGTYWVIVDGGFATTTYYGKTKLYTGAASTSTAYALTPSSLNQFAENVVTGYPAYSTSATYAVGDRVRYSVRVYECITAIPDGESWTAAHWKEVDDLQTQLDNKIKPNPTLEGTEAALTGVEIDGVKYKIAGGGGLPEVTASDNGKVLTVVNGAWAAASLPIYDGSVT